MKSYPVLVLEMVCICCLVMCLMLGFRYVAIEGTINQIENGIKKTFKVVSDYEESKRSLSFSIEGVIKEVKSEEREVDSYDPELVKKLREENGNVISISAEPGRKNKN